MKTFNAHLWGIASCAIFMNSTASQAALVSYASDANTLHLYTFDEVAGGSSTANAGSKGGNALTVQESSTSNGTNTATLNTTMLGQPGYLIYGNAASIAKVASTTNPAGNQGVGFDFSTNGAYSQGSGTSTAAQDRITDYGTYFSGGSYTLEAMINIPSTANAGAVRSIISLESNINASRSMYLRIDGGNLQLGNAGSFRSIAIPTTGDDAFVANEWFHVAVVHDSVAQTTQFYWTRMDPSRTAAVPLGAAFTGPQVPQNPSGSPNLMIGSDSRQGMTESLGGLIDNVRISNIARTSGDFVFAAGSGDTDSDNLLDAWEQAFFSNWPTPGQADPLRYIGTNDPDEDTFNNEAEESAGSDPTNPASTPLDKDGDGLADLWEDQYFGNNNAVIETTDLTPQNGTGDPDLDLATNEQEESAGSNPTLASNFPDTDTDSLNDAWEVFHFTTIAAQTGTGDADSDGATNLAEQTAGSNPNNPASLPADIDADGLADLWEDLYFGNNDEIIQNSDLTPQNGTGDPDLDLATNEAEETAGAVPNDKFSFPDTDGDGLSDPWELAFFTNLAQTDIDTDGDSYINSYEFADNTNPNNIFSSWDSDSDSLADGWEIFYFVQGGESAGNPTDVGNILARQTGIDDPDLDTFSNDAEETAGSNPNSLVSVPTDTDGDGLLDSWEQYWAANLTTLASIAGDNDSDGAGNSAEFAAGSNPLVAASTPADMDGNGTPDANEFPKPYAVDSSTLHLWHLNETTAPFVNSVNPAYNLLGQINGAAGWAPGVRGFGTGINTNTGSGTNRGIVAFNTTLDTGITADVPGGFQWNDSVTGAFTIDLLVKFDSLPNTWALPGHLVSMDGDGGLTQDRVFQFRIEPNAGSPRLQFQRLNPTVSSVDALLPTTGDHAINTTDWFHVAVAYDGNESGGAGNIKLYWTKVAPGNVSAVELPAINGFLSADFGTSVGDLSIGNEARAAGGSTEYFQGSLDEVRISSVARASNQFLLNPDLGSNPDSDGDGLLDAWETTYFSSIATENGSGDPDNDGRSNLIEFALDGNPSAGVNDGKTPGRIASVGGQQVLTLTVPIRGGATFSGSNGLVSGLIDGIIYRIQGSDSLGAWDLAVSEVTGPDATAIQTGLPALNSGWEYRTFRSPGTVTDGDPRDFLRAVVETP